MRKSTQETAQELRMLLSKLEADWGRINRPQVSKDLRDSLHTRIVEVKASLAACEDRLSRGVADPVLEFDLALDEDDE